MKKKALVISLVVFIIALVSILSNPVSAAEKKYIGIIAGRPGDPWFSLSHALATFISEKSDRLRAEVVASAGIGDNIRMVVGKPEFAANHLVVTMIPGYDIWGEKIGFYPKSIGSLGMVLFAWVTLDPNIKTLADLKGKRVAMGRNFDYGYQLIPISQLEQVGVWKTVKALHGGHGAMLNSIRDGAAQAAHMMFNTVYPDKFKLGSFLEELQARGTLYFIGMGDVATNVDMIAKACRTKYANYHVPTLASVVPAKALAPTQTEDLVAVTVPTFWAAGKEMPEDVVYEITKILFEAAQKGDFKPYHMMGEGLTPNFLTSSFWETEEMARKQYHPGAVKFYDEAKIRLKSFSQDLVKYRK